MKAGGAPRLLFHQDFNELRQAGYLCMNVPEELGGMDLKNPWTPRTIPRATLADHTQVLLHRIRDTIRGIEPAARIILYGSRARGDARPDSDWDLLILLNGAVDHHHTATVRHRLYDLELESDMVLSAMVLSNAVWENPLSRAMPFYTNVMGEGIEL